MGRVAVWHKRCGNEPMKRGTDEWKTSLLNQLARLQEELDEVIEAVEAGDEPETLKELTDVRVVFEGLVFLSDLPVDEAFDLVMDNNDTKYTNDVNFASASRYALGVEEHQVLAYQEMTEPNEEGYQYNVGEPYFSVHRVSDNKICKLLNHEKLDLTSLLGGV